MKMKSINKKLKVQTESFKTRLSDGSVYDVSEGEILFAIRKTDHGNIKEAKQMPHTYPDLESGTEVIVKGITIDVRGIIWLKCEVPNGVIYNLNPMHLAKF